MRAALGWMLTRPQAWWRGVWVLILEVGGAVLIPIGVVAFVLELGNREEDRINRAWSLIAAAKVEGTGNVGLIEAMETLARRGTDLALIKLPGAYLAGVHLNGASLYEADLRGADLTNADLKQANLIRANLSKANLTFTDLSGTDLTGADLSEAAMRMTIIEGSTLQEVKLEKTEMVGIDLRQALNLDFAFMRSSTDLKTALFCKTQMPDGSWCNRDCKGEILRLVIALGFRGVEDRGCPFFDGQAQSR